MSENSPKVVLPWQDAETAQRAVLNWLNTYPELPAPITFEGLPEDSPGMALLTIQTAFKTRQYITGGYEAQYQFDLLYRIQPSDDQDRLGAVELLNRMGGWVEQTRPLPEVASGVQAKRVTRTNGPALAAVYEDGTTDYKISMTMTWEVF